jgi:hypothetical protein
MALLGRVYMDDREKQYELGQYKCVKQNMRGEIYQLMHEYIDQNAGVNNATDTYCVHTEFCSLMVS